MEELKGYVQIYTAWGGYHSYLITGACHGTVQPKGNFIYSIIVPREAVAVDKEWHGGEEEPPEYIHVDLNRRFNNKYQR